MINKWHKYFMNIAKETAKLSKDESTKVGAVFVKDKQIKSCGFNGAPASFPDDEVPSDNTSDQLIYKKNTYMCHAELNAILHYSGPANDLRNSTVYVTVSPCSNCAKMLAQLNINEVIYDIKYHNSDETDAAEAIFKKCGIAYTPYSSL